MADPGSKTTGPIAAILAVVAIALGAGLYAVVSGRPCPVAPRPEPLAQGQPLSPTAALESSALPTAQDPQPPFLPSRQSVNKLIDEQKYEAAATECARLRAEARRIGDTSLWTWALIKEGQLRTALHGYETAVRFFREEPWPDTPLERDMLELFYANSLLTYYRAYSWEINRRERVESAGTVDLKSWTREQIFDEAWRSALRAWKDRDRLSQRRSAEFPDFWAAGDYPPSVRGTLRDAVAHLLAGLLSDTTFWTPRQTNDLWTVDLKTILAHAGKTSSDEASLLLGSSTAHPVERLAALLGEHESWSRRAGRPEAALEARFELVRSLAEAFSGEEDHALLRRHLATFLALSSSRRHAWWAVGQALLAEMTMRESAPDALVRARRIALEGARRFPGTPGGQRALYLVRSIESPSFEVESMGLDAPGRRSLRVTHRNIDRLYFRAYALDAEALILSSKDYDLFPRGDRARRLVETLAPNAAWNADLPKTPDFRDHRTYVNTPETLTPGLYLIAASAREDFASEANKTVGLRVVVGDLVMIKRRGDPPGLSHGQGGGVEVFVLSGSTGRPVPGATVDLYLFDWRRGHSKIDSRTTDATGHVVFGPQPRGATHFLIAKKGRDLVFDSEFLSPRAERASLETRAALIYTDRSIYRPGQRVLWKVLAYRGRPDIGQFAPEAGSAISVWLEDVNGQKVAEATASTNAFGTASGELLIPAAGRPLGLWRLHASPQGDAAVRVEEYKRPTFEVSFKDPDSPLRLNRAAALRGEARYYFGLPVATGEAVWHVRREPIYPSWWWGETGARAQTIAGGRTALSSDGSFTVEFTPLADERKAGPSSGLSYRYTLSVDVTDEGGETRSASRTFRLGFVSVESRIEAEGGFLQAGAPSRIMVHRADLDGTPRPGKGAWRVVRLAQPERALLPADQPVPDEERSVGSSLYPPTPGDKLRPRWEPCGPESILRLWKEGVEAARGTAEHDAKGAATIAIPPLEPGAYRLLYETKDDFGAVWRDRLDLLVAGGPPASLKLPLVLKAERPSVPVGGKARLLLDAGWSDQPLLFETFRASAPWERRWLELGRDGGLIEIPVTEDMRGGFGVRVTALRDHQLMAEEVKVLVPWDSKELGLSFETFRDKLAPGGRETWRIKVTTPSGKPAERGAAELLAYMYDRSLDLFAPHRPPRLTGIYPVRTGTAWWDSTLGRAPTLFHDESGWRDIPGYPTFRPDELFSLSGYGIGGPGRGTRRMAERGVIGGVVGGVLGGVVGEVEEAIAPREAQALSLEDKAAKGGAPTVPPSGESPVELRSSFAETAFWQPHLLTGPDGTATIEFTAPDSVTSWRVFVHGLTRDLAGGTLEAEARTVKELMVRPYLPRFFREGDRAELRVVVNNAGDREASGEVRLEITDPATGENLAPAFGLPAAVPPQPFVSPAGGGSAVVFPLVAPARVGTVAFKVTARSGELSDGELRPLPVLPGRMHLVQSRFATLREGKPRELRFEDLARTDDPTRLSEQLVLTIDAQLFYGLLSALPYLVSYPYECTEQTLNRFLSTGILTSLYDKYPAAARMAQELSRRETRYEAFDEADPNRKMSLEETPWLETARGGKDEGLGLEKVLDPRVAEAQRRASLAKLLEAQTSLGAFPWWPGGPPSPYMTLYIVHGFSKALEFGVDVPKEPVVRAFGYLRRHCLDEIVAQLTSQDTGWELATFLNYVLSNFPDPSWTGGVFSTEDRTKLLELSFRHWKEHSPYLKGFLALTLKRAGRAKDAALVWGSVMDSARTTPDEGTSWAPEDRGWLWYNDTIETHAFALRTLLELAPADKRSEGLVQWLFLNKKLNHWKSTRATAEVLYAVAWDLDRTAALAVRESVTAEACGLKAAFLFEPDKFTGKKNQLVVPGERLGPDCATVRLTKTGKGLAFASATWHFSTDRLPEKGEGDLFAVDRTYFKRERRGGEVVLRPLAEGAPLAVGDELEVHLSIRARHPAEYVHLRDPRPAGCEPVALRSGVKWDLGLVRYEEVRDSGTNFFIEWLPQGEYTLRHRLRCATAGTFKAAPATLQSMYAPEFAAYSPGALIVIR